MFAAVTVAAVLAPQPLAETEGSITYTAKNWLAGLKVVVPNAGWTIYEDRAGEFSLKTPPALGDGYLHFWLDPHAPRRIPRARSRV